MLRPVLMAFLAGLLLPSVANSSGKHDGQWKAQGKPTQSCNEQADILFTLEDNKIMTGSVTGPRGVGPLQGQVGDDGSGVIYIRGDRLQGTFQIHDAMVIGKLNTRCGWRDFEGSRTQ